jgi:hypothetical protein
MIGVIILQKTVLELKSKWSNPVIAIVILAILISLFFLSKEIDILIMDITKLQIFKTIFISIILEALPFLLVGVFISAIIHVFVPEQVIKNLIPKNPVLGILSASLLGIIFPICECGMVPVIRRLISKGMPLYISIVFILVGPILNPIVFFSTFMAFRNRPEITFSRMGLAFLVALVIGLLIYRFIKSDQIKVNKAEKHSHHSHEGDHHDHGQHLHGNKLIEVMAHITSEFFQMGKFLIFGSIVAAGLQTLVARESLVLIGHGPIASNLLMMALAYLLSLCSTSDAFVASSFTTTFSSGSLLAFLVFGPMLNFKETLMLLAVFKKKFVILLSILVILNVLKGSLLFEWFIL